MAVSEKWCAVAEAGNLEVEGGQALEACDRVLRVGVEDAEDGLIIMRGDRVAGDQDAGAGKQHAMLPAV